MNWKNACLAGTLATALVFGACNKNNDDDTTNNVNAQDETFVVQASKSNRAEVELGNLALTKGTAGGVKTYAQMMVTEHTTAQTDLQTIVNNANTNVSLNDSLDADQVAMRTMLQALSGRSFDSAYLNSQVVSHQKTLANFDTEIAGGQNAQVKGYATSKRPNIQMHLTMADSLYKANY